MDMQVHVKTYTVLVVNTNGCLQISLNQLALGPVVTAVVFTWNLVLQNRASEVPDKLRQDFVPTLVNGKPESPLANTCVPSSTQVQSMSVHCHAAGWKFWVPAASINFWVVPIQSQVLYMSVCGLLWTAYLSYSSNSRHQLVKV